jgi:hypothetical protein
LSFNLLSDENPSQHDATSIFAIGESFTETAEHSEATGFDPVPSCDTPSNYQAQRAQTCPKQQRADITLLIERRNRENHQGDQSD